VAMAAVAACFLAWASAFIYKLSFTIEGNRYFSLFDDAMISMRYARNFSEGYGLVWNPGEYVEGYTNPLMTLLMSVSNLLFNDVGAVLSVQVAGVGFMLVNACLVAMIAGYLGSELSLAYRKFLQVLSFSCALSYYPFAYWSLMGMETGLLAVLISASVLLALRYSRSGRGGLAMSTCLGLAFLTRTDAALYAIPVFAYAFYAARARGVRWGALLGMVGVFTLFVVGQEAFRLYYYGELLPNTYTLKVEGAPLYDRLKNGIGFLTPFISEIVLLLALVVYALLFDARKEIVLLAAVFAVPIVYQVWTGGDAWNYWRILAPAVPLALVVAACEVVAFIAAMSDSAVFRSYFSRKPFLSTQIRMIVPSVVAAALVVFVILSVNWRFLPEATLRADVMDQRLNEYRVGVALALKKFTTEEATVGTVAAGAIPYYSRRPAVDFLGKSDSYIAHLAPDFSGTVAAYGTSSLPGHNKYDLAYSIGELRPDYVETLRYGKQDFSEMLGQDYVLIVYRGKGLTLKKSSREVLWEEIDKAVEAGQATYRRPG
jgi:arabinofuranosyltransferase